MAQITFRVMGYRDGWRGLGAHLWDVLRGTPVRTMRDVTATVSVDLLGRAKVEAMVVTLPEKRKEVRKPGAVEV